MSPSRRLLLRKILARLAFVVAALATLIVIFYTEERWRGRRAWEAYRVKAEARGEKLWLADFIPPQIPPGDNYAANPFVEELFREGAAGKNPPPMLPSFTGEGKKRPSLGDVATGTGPDLATWRDFLSAAKPAPDTTPALELLVLLEKQAPALQQLRDVSSRGQCRFPTAWEKGFSTVLPHLAPLNECGALFHLSVSANLADGQPATAATEVGHLFRLHTALGSEPSIIAGLVSNAVLENALGAVREGLASGQWTTADLAEFEKQLEAVDVLADFRRAMGTERGAFNTEAVRMAGMSGRELQQFWTDVQLGPLPVGYLPSGWVWQNMVTANEYYDSVLEPYQPAGGSEPAFIPARPQADDWLRTHLGTSGFQRTYYFLVNALLPTTDTCEVNFLSTETHVIQARIACELERAHQARKSFPEKLQDVFAAVPKDVCDGQPMRYRRTDDGGYVLWSVAMNRKDDGGDASPAETPRLKQADWLWRMPAR